MKSLYDFDIYYNGERLNDIIDIDIDDIPYMNCELIKIKYIKDTKLVTITDNFEKFSFVERSPMMVRLEDMQ